MTSAFANNSSQRYFSLLCLVTFLGSLSLSALIFLSALLNEDGYSQQAIGSVLSAPLVPTLIALFSTGALLQKISCIRLMIISQALMILGFIGLEYALSSSFLSTIFRGLIGFGSGFYFSASMIYVRSLLSGPKIIYFFGIYASMFPLPNAFGPIVAQWYFKNHGSDGFFLYMALPGLLALLTLIALSIIFKEFDRSSKPAAIRLHSYYQILCAKRFHTLGLGIFSIGVLWGFVTGYMALYLSQHNFSVGLFFLPMSLALFGSRFGLLGILSGFSCPVLVACSFVLMACAFALVLNLHSPIPIILAGICFGVGYSLGFPILSVWVSDSFDIDQRPIALSAFNASFYCGIFGVPSLIGLLALPPNSSYPLFLLMALAIGMGIFFSIAFKNQVQGRQA
ncbi:MFS transporter [Polynucleobacter paneuropaeus]|nr:MFS transporter [Polynucleobacter paneuropaeus]